jgi:hypothetical protein
MMHQSLRLAVLSLVLSLPAAAQQQPSMPAMQEAKPETPDHPGLGELMTAFVQPRHIKLGLAGTQQNWAYAAYELGELRETFDDVAELVPKHDNLAIPEMIGATMKEPLAALDKAIKDKNVEEFKAGYAQLTAGCNSCHQSANHPMIVIKVPTVSDFPDQEFRPQK